MTQMMRRKSDRQSRVPSNLQRRRRNPTRHPTILPIGLQVLTGMKPLLIPLVLTCMCLLFQLSSPFVGATQDVSRATGTCVTNVNSMDTGVRTVHSTGTSCSQRRTTDQDKAPYDTCRFNFDSHDKYFYCNVLDSNLDTNTEFSNFLEQVLFFENAEKTGIFHGVKGNLAKHIHFWERIGASDFILNTIKGGYVIPFLNSPPSMNLRNINSAFINHSFVDEAVAELVESGAVKEVPFKPFVTNPLSVASNKSGKLRLILDLSVLNKYVRKDRFKFEDWKVAIQYFTKNCSVFKFDLKSGYHHIDICPQQHTFLGFSWKGKYFCFTVLPFGLSTTPFIFSKCLREMVKY